MQMARLPRTLINKKQNSRPKIDEFARPLDQGAFTVPWFSEAGSVCRGSRIGSECNTRVLSDLRKFSNACKKNLRDATWHSAGELCNAASYNFCAGESETDDC